jgi:class 3 adenylate cyclase
MAARGNRTVLCSVVFIDIVEYSKKSVEEQMQVKQQFNALLLRSLADVPEEDRIILDTGDGAAINFLGDPEECLFVAITLRDALAAPDQAGLALRIGINLGPVRLIKDINGQPNIIGDGINVAQRIMGFADVNQILVSRSFYELISALSADYAQLFAFEGSRTDKHVREHEVYALGIAAAPRRVQRRPVPAQTPQAAAAWRRVEFAAAAAHAQIMRRPPLATALAVGSILALAIGLRAAIRSPEAPIAERAEAPAVEAAIPAPPQPAPASPKPRAEADPQRGAEPVAGPAPVLAAKPAAAPPPEARAQAAAPPEARPQPEPRPQAERPAVGLVKLHVVPWGEVYVDGRKFGVTPPLIDLALSAGVHRIEIRNPGFPSHVQVVEVRAREEIRIRHRFQ